RPDSEIEETVSSKRGEASPSSPPLNPGERSVFKILVVGLLLVLLIGGVSGGLFLNEKINLLSSTVIDGPSPESSVSIDRRGNTETIIYDFGDQQDISLKEPYSSDGIYFWSEHIFISRTEDASGVHLVANGATGDMVYNPAAIARYGLNQYSNYLKLQDPVYMDDARVQADYLVDALDPETGVLLNEFDSTINTGSAYEILRAPWVSADAQGLTCSLLARMYDQTGDEKYSEACKLAIQPFLRTVEDGGVTREFQGYTFFESYPTKLPDFELSGFMNSLIGLFDVWQITQDETAYSLYTQGVETLEFSLPYFDSAGISNYQLAHLFRSSGTIYIPGTAFHIDHIQRLEAINQYEESPVLAHYIKLWTMYIKGNAG
ncbi:MAG: D-glucuronyl C5-epimerase family protein, partial [Coriobacteriales bacterium]|nr:D-glucuronyl C5-epimerase family protein [Coriobacteriales bacterium]